VKRVVGAIKKQTFLTGALTLAGAGILCRLIGVAFRIPFANVVGNYGMGLYQMVFPLYALLLIISSAGIPIAISKLVSKERANSKDAGLKCYREPRRILLSALVLLFIIGAIVSALFLVFARQIAIFQGNEGVTKIYLAIAPAVLLVCLLSAFKGYFQGLGNMIPTAVSQIVEQTVKVSVAIALAFLLLPRGVDWAVFGAIVGVTVSEVVGLAVIATIYLVHVRKSGKDKGRNSTKEISCVGVGANNVRPPSKASRHENFLSGKIFVAGERCSPLHEVKDPLLFEDYSGYEKPNGEQRASATGGGYVSLSLMWLILKKSLPITLLASIFPLLLVFDSMVVIRLLQDGGASNEVATQLYGISSGTVHTLINMPAILGIAIGTAVVPMTAGLLQQNKVEEARCKGMLSVKMIFFVALFFVLFYVAFSREIITLLYERAFQGNEEHLNIAMRLLKIESAMIMLMGMTQIFTAMLQGSGRSNFPLFSLIVGGSLKVAFSLIFIRTGLGIYAVSISNLICFSVAFSLNAFFVWKFLKIRPKISWDMWKTVVLVGVYVGVLVGLFFLLPSGKWWIVLGGFAALAVYVGLVFGLDVFELRKQRKFRKLV